MDGSFSLRALWEGPWVSKGNTLARGSLLKAGGWCLYPVHIRKQEEGTLALLFPNCLKFPHAGPKTSQIQGNCLCERLGRRNWGRRARELGCLRSVWPSGSMVS